MNHHDIMKLAIEEAELAIEDGNAPFACVVVNSTGEIILKEHDRVKESVDPTAHGEINAIRKLCKQLNTLSLAGYTFYTTSEPCPTCFSAMLKAKVPRVYYGAKTEKTASLPVSIEELASRATEYQMQIIGGILEQEIIEQRKRRR